jgi:hemerythrin
MESNIDIQGWTKDLETGIDVLDGQHRKYFDLLENYFKKVSEMSAGPEEILDLAEKFNFLRQYAEEHFEAENTIMQNANYPDYERHHDEHLHFLEHVEELYESLKIKGFSPELAREVNYYTVEWFVGHIRITDMKLVEFLNQQSAEDKKIPAYLKKLYTSLFGTK